MTRPVYLVSSILFSFLAGTGCGLLDGYLPPGDRPSDAQLDAVGDIFSHLGDVGDVVADPTAAPDDALVATASPVAFVGLLAPTDAGARVAARRVVADASDEGCVVVEGDTATLSCDVPVGPASCAEAPGDCCLVTGVATQSGSDYAAELEVAGARCGALSVDAAFSLEPPAGTLAYLGAGPTGEPVAGTGDYTLDVELQIDALCPDGRPAEGRLSVSGQGTIVDASAGAPRDVDFDGAVTIEWTEFQGECGAMFVVD